MGFSLLVHWAYRVFPLAYNAYGVRGFLVVYPTNIMHRAPAKPDFMRFRTDYDKK